MYRFLTKKELKGYNITRETVLKFYEENAGRNIPEESIIGKGVNIYNSPVIKVDNGILREKGLFTSSPRQSGHIALFKEISIDDNGNLLLDIF